MALESNCAHKFVYQGVRYCCGANPLPGSGATRVYYAHVYFCEHCLETKGKAIEGIGSVSSYEKISFDATPGSKEECCVPKHDLNYGRY